MRPQHGGGGGGGVIILIVQIKKKDKKENKSKTSRFRIAWGWNVCVYFPNITHDMILVLVAL